jgi:murein DD-endopeptidase MepM/ murein hydrolase activator NlpD
MAGGTVAGIAAIASEQPLPLWDGPDVRVALHALTQPLAAHETTAAPGDPIPLDRVPAFAPVMSEPSAGVDGAALVKAADLGREVARRAAARTIESAPSRPPAAAVAGVRLVTARLTSGFGVRWNAQHRGLDLAAPIGTPVRAPLNGTVIDAGPASGFGLWVRIRHADGTVTVYGHINLAFVQVGQRVSAGQVIAEVGNRGESTGPHLHFEVIRPGQGSVNPIPWLAERKITYR